MTYAVYAYRPKTIRSLTFLIEREALGLSARFERFAANMLYWIAAGRKIDVTQSERFSVQMDEIYENPFKRKKQEPQTAAEIKQYLMDKLEEMIDGLDDAGGEDHAG